MALSHRFGIIQSLGLTPEDDETCEEYHLLQRLIGKNTLFSCPSNFQVLSNSGDNKNIGHSDSEEEKVDPLWRVEFQNILRKCKQRSGTVNKGLFCVSRRNEDDIKSLGHFEDESCDGILNEKLILDENGKHDGQEFFNVDKSYGNVNENLIIKDTNNKNVKVDDLKNVSEENEINQNRLNLSLNKVCQKVQSSKEKLIYCDKVSSDEKADKDDLNNKDLNNKCLTESSKENLEPFGDIQLINEIKQVTGKAKVAQRERKSKISSDSTKTTKKVKSVVKVIPSKCFPLDELLPKKPKLENMGKNQSKPLNTMEKINVNAMDNLLPYNSNMHSYISPTQDDDSVFHGEVYDSPVIEDFEPFSVNRSDSLDYDASYFDHHEFTESLDGIKAMESDKVDAGTSRNPSLKSFSFIIDALHEGNDSFVEQLQNVLSKQNKNGPCDQQKPSPTGGNSEENMDDNSFSSGSFHRYSVASGENLQINNTERDGDLDTKRDNENNPERLLARKEDNQSNKLFRLFVDQCSQLVKTDEDRNMLASLVKLLKRESGSELFSTTGFTPPTTPSNHSICDRITTPTTKNEADVELFEGRTLLKGGVPPRHIPKTAIIKTGNDRPMDPRPISTMLSKPKAKPLPLPKFIYEMHDSSVIQRILTLDWDCKRSLFLDDNNDLHKDSDSIRSYNPSKDLQKMCARSCDNKVCPVQSTMKGNTSHDEFERGIKEDSLDKTTPLKDEARKAYQGDGQEAETALHLGNSVYGRCKAIHEIGTFDEETNLKFLKDKISDLIQDTCNKRAKRGLFSELTESENQRSLKANIALKDKNQSIPNDFGLDYSNDKAQFINTESVNSYDFKSLIKTDSFLGSLEKLSFSTLTDNNGTSPPSDSNNNNDTDLNVEDVAFSESGNNGQSKQQNSLEVYNVATESYKNQSLPSTGASHSFPDLLNDTINKDASESSEYQSSFDKNSSQSIPVHLSSATRQVDRSPKGVHVEGNVIKSNTLGKIGKKIESSNISYDVREEGEVTPDLEDVIVLSDDEDDGGNMISVYNKDSRGNKKSTSKSTKENELTKASHIDISKTNKEEQIEKKVTTNKARSGNNEICANKTNTKIDISLNKNSVKLDEFSGRSENCIEYARNIPGEIRTDSRNEVRQKKLDEKYSNHHEISNKKRKITATKVRLSCDFEYQDEPDNSVTDEKRKKGEESDETIMLPHNKRKHIRERKRHSSCSSVESIKLNDQRRGSSNHGHRHKSTVTSIRSSTEVRSSTPSLSRSRSNSSDKSRYSSNQTHSTAGKSKHSRSLSHSTTDKSKHSSSQNHSNTDRLVHSGNLSHSSTNKSKHSSSHSNSNTEKSRHFSSQSLSRSESSAGHRKRHHTVHDNGQSTAEKKSRLETFGANISKRRHSDDHKFACTSSHSNETKSSDVKRSSLLYDDILSPEYTQNTDSENFSSLTEQSKAEHSQIISKPQKYEDILSPENSGLSDEMLSEEYQRLFGKKKDTGPISAEGNPGKPLQKSIFSKVLPNKFLGKSLEDDMKFLESYKQKVQKKETTTAFVGDPKSEKSLDFKQELEDRKFLQMCKKRKEEKAKLSFEQQMRDYKKD